jgi:hypothetical protein
LAKELGKTVRELTRELTREELIGWAAYFKIQNDEMEKDREAAQKGSATRTQKR